MTKDQSYAALCAWEHIIHQMISRTDKYWNAVRAADGMAALREQTLDMGVKIDTAYNTLPNECAYDWDFVPDLIDAMEDPLSATQDQFNEAARGLL